MKEKICARARTERLVRGIENRGIGNDPAVLRESKPSGYVKLNCSTKLVGTHVRLSLTVSICARANFKINYLMLS